MNRFGVCLLLSSLCLCVSVVNPPPNLAQDRKKPEKTPDPRVTVVIPLGAAPGKASKLTIRGLQLDSATAVRFNTDKASVKILTKGTASVPDKNPDKVGDTQLVVEVTLPADVPDGPLSFTVVTPGGDT